MSAVVVKGTLGWGNTKPGYELYGPGGRWGSSANNRQGDSLADALEAAGAHEGARVVVVAANPFDSDAAATLEAVLEAATSWPVSQVRVAVVHDALVDLVRAAHDAGRATADLETAAAWVGGLLAG